MRVPPFLILILVAFGSLPGVLGCSERPDTEATAGAAMAAVGGGRASAGGGVGGTGAGGSDAGGTEPTDEAGAPAAVGGGASAGCDAGTGMALAFKNDVIDLVAGDLGPDLPGGNMPRTVELWAHFLGPQSWLPDHTIIELGRRVDGMDQVFGLDMAGRDGTSGIFGPYTNDLGDNDPTPVALSDEGWYHVAWSYDGAGHFQLVVDGVSIPLQNPGDGSGMLSNAPGLVTLGASQSFGWEGWEGVMDEVRIWSVFRSDAEIVRDMRVKLTGREPGLVAYYDFDRGRGTTVDDALSTPGHKLLFCPNMGGVCPAPNNASPSWVKSDMVRSPARIEGLATKAEG